MGIADSNSPFGAIFQSIAEPEVALLSSGTDMSKANQKVIQNELQVLVKDAQTLLQDAAALTGTKAEEVRAHGMQMLDKALHKAQDIQDSTIAATREMAATADGYVKENPWRAIIALAGLSLLLGAYLGRR
jgi:ElaB/YqjD/DUF883 family membrane-anchored ribosome-binding protein